MSFRFWLDFKPSISFTVILVVFNTYRFPASSEAPVNLSLPDGLKSPHCTVSLACAVPANNPTTLAAIIQERLRTLSIN